MTLHVNKEDIPRVLLRVWEDSESKLSLSDWVQHHYKQYRGGLSATMKPLTLTRWMSLYRVETYRASSSEGSHRGDAT